MYIYFKVCAFLLLISLFACKKDEAPALNRDYWGEAYALKNGEVWKPMIIGIADDKCTGKFSILFNINNDYDTYIKKGYWTENLHITSLPEKKGSYKLFNVIVAESDSTEAFYATSNDDVLGDAYNTDNSADNFLEVTEYNPETREVKGTFNITIILDKDDNEGPTPPNTLRFINGTFHTKIKDER